MRAALSEDSADTRKLVEKGVASVLLSALENGTVFVDKLDTKLHPKLIRYMILLLKNPKINKDGAQLIFTSQDISTQCVSPHEIWFAACEEDETNRLWSLSDLHEPNGHLLSKKAALDKRHLSGRNGADAYLTRVDEWG